MPTYSGDSDGEFDESGDLPTDEDEEEQDEPTATDDGDAAVPDPELVDRKRAIAARKASRGAAPTTPAPPPPAAAAPPERSPLGKRKRVKPGRPGEKRRGPPPARAAIGAAAVAEMNSEAGQAPREVLRPEAGRIDPTQEPTGDIVARWPIVLEQLTQEGLGPEAVTMRVHAVAEGPYATAPAYLGAIDGRSVVGGGDLAPADALAMYIEQVYQAQQRGAVRYQLDVHYKVAPPHRSRGSTFICRGYLTLQPYEVIVAQRRREEAFRQETARVIGAPPRLPSPMPGLGAVGGGYYPPPSQPSLPAQSVGPSYSETLMREVFERLLRGETIGPQAIGVAAPPMLMQMPPAPPPEPAPPPPPPPTLEEQLEGFARMMKLVQSLQPPPPQVVQAPAVGVGRAAREEAPLARVVPPESAVDQFKGALALLRDFKKINEELTGMSGGGGDDDDEEEPAPKEEPPFRIADMGGYKWPHGKGLGRLDQLQQFMMLNPNVTLQVLQGISKIVDQSAIRGLLETLAQRGNPQQASAAQQAMQQGLGAPQPQALPPVVRPQSAPPPPNGAVHPPVYQPPPVASVGAGFTPVT